MTSSLFLLIWCQTFLPVIVVAVDMKVAGKILRDTCFFNFLLSIELLNTPS